MQNEARQNPALQSLCIQHKSRNIVPDNYKENENLNSKNIEL